jgi:serine/threonine protein kinase
MSLLSSLCHPNIIHAHGFCSEPTLSLLTESFDQTSMDLYQYLQYYNQEAAPGDTLGTLALHLASQLSSALAYLESLHISHRDVAARNCCVGLDLTVKLHDLAMSNETYADDYALVTLEDGTRTRRPVRWCAWESICQVGKRKCDSSYR